MPSARRRGTIPGRLWTVEIRERSHRDLDQLVAVTGRVHVADRYPIFLPKGDFYRFLTRPMPVAAWVAVRDGSVVGHVALNAETSRPVLQLVAELKSERPVLYIARLFVDPGAGRAGIGRELLEHARRATGRVDERVDCRHFVSHPRLGAAFLSSAIFMAAAPTVIISSTTFASSSGLKSAVHTTTVVWSACSTACAAPL